MQAASPVDKLWISKMCIDFGAIQVVYFESSDKDEPSLDLRVESGSEQKLS